MPHSLYATDTDLTADNLLRLPAEFGCPVWVYDAQIIRRQIAQLSQFDVVRFAQKACSNIHILRLMREQGGEGGLGVAGGDRAGAGGRLRSAAESRGYCLYRRSDRRRHPRSGEGVTDPGERRLDRHAEPAGRGCRRAIASGCASTRDLVTATARKPIPAVRTASMASGTATCRRRWK